MKIDFKDKIIVITGAASGIGRVTSRMMIEDNATVILIDINEAVQSIARSLGDNAHSLICDVSDGVSVKKAFDWIKGKFNGIDILINNAGIQTYGNVTETEEKDWDRTFGVNVKSIYLCAKYAVPLMLQRKAPVVINVASVKSFVCQKNEAAYVASKTAVIGLTRSIAADFAPVLRCVAVCPGAVNTPLLMDEIKNFPDKEAIVKETEDIHLVKRIAEPEEIASFILFLASSHAGFATGHAYRVDGGIGVLIAGT